MKNYSVRVKLVSNSAKINRLFRNMQTCMPLASVYNMSTEIISQEVIKSRRKQTTTCAFPNNTTIEILATFYHTFSKTKLLFTYGVCP